MFSTFTKDEGYTNFGVLTNTKHFLYTPNKRTQLKRTQLSTQPNCGDLEGMTVFRSASGSDLDIRNLEKYFDWNYRETAKSSQTKTRGRPNEDINCSTSLFNEENNKQYGSFSQNNPILGEFITRLILILTLCNQHLWKRDLAISLIPASLVFRCSK